MLITSQVVYIKRFARALGFKLEFDWPGEMVTVTNLAFLGNSKLNP